MEMCRFGGLDDVEYKKVAAALRRITTAVPGQLKAVRQSLLSEEEKGVLLASLKFDQIDARQMTIKKAHAQTCKWLLESPKYLDWLDPSQLGEHHGFLWYVESVLSLWVPLALGGSQGLHGLCFERLPMP
jgi:hypothetical protein